MSDLFSSANNKSTSEYDASHIEVLEKLEPVRRRPGMYIGGTDVKAMEHLAREVLDNAMDEAVAGYASRIEIHLQTNNTITISDNGRGIPVGKHPKYPDKSALEVILTTLHAGGKFSNKAYHTAGGLHGVGISVVNALSDNMEVEVIRDKKIYHQRYSKGEPLTSLEKVGQASNRRGTTITFHPDPEIFGNLIFRPRKLYNLVRSKAYLFKGVEIRWKCDAAGDDIPKEDTIHFPRGLIDFLESETEGNDIITKDIFSGEAELADSKGKVEWAVCWSYEDGFSHSYCNTIPTHEGGTHITGLRAVLLKGLKAYADMLSNKQADKITADDIVAGANIILSVFLREPQFQGQTKEKLGNNEVSKLVENAMRDHFDHWLSANVSQSKELLQYIIERTEERLRRRQAKKMTRKTATEKLRLPGKLADCMSNSPIGTELFLVEGDSAGGSAKMARDRKTQAILPLRGKILNVASATGDKIRANQEISDMFLALGCGHGRDYNDDDLRYEKVIIMTDADVDGAHITSLLMTFFYREMSGLIENGHLYLAQPPLYRITAGTKHYYAKDETHRDEIVKSLGNRKIDVGRFKGLGEMTPKQLKETTMNPETRVLLKVMLEDEQEAKDKVEDLMGKKPAPRFKFITEQMNIKGEEIFDTLDV